MACTQGTVCSNGVCSSACDAGLALCGSSCVDLGSSAVHCGQCGRACDAGRACVSGTCECTQGRIACGDSGCVDITEDAQHCGQCNNACSPGSVCQDGTCRSAGGSGGTSGAGGTNSGGTGAFGGTSSGGTANGGTDAGGAGASGAGAGGMNTGGAGAGGTNAGGAGASATGGSSGSSSGCNATGFHVQDGRLYDVNCNEFVMRGVNYPYAWYASRNTQQDLDAIAAAGANAVRIVMATGARWTRTDGSTLTSLIQWSKAARLVAVLEVHDTTGYSEQSGSVPLSNATSYWTNQEIVAALRGQEAYVIINVGNEPNGNNTTDAWASSHVTAVQALRNADLDHTLMVDAPNWGQDWTNTMRDGAGSAIWDADSAKNLIFSVHMYDVYGSSSSVSSYFNTFLSNYSAPLVVGEFASDHGSSGNVDEGAVMMYAETLGIGYLGWSWSGNSSDLATLDITNGFDANSLTSWGERLINGTDGLKETAQPCSCF